MSDQVVDIQEDHEQEGSSECRDQKLGRHQISQRPEQCDYCEGPNTNCLLRPLALQPDEKPHAHGQRNLRSSLKIGKWTGNSGKHFFRSLCSISAQAERAASSLGSLAFVVTYRRVAHPYQTTGYPARPMSVSRRSDFICFIARGSPERLVSTRIPAFPIEYQMVAGRTH